MNNTPGTPRKIIVASVMFGPYGTFPGLENRLRELEHFIDRAVEASTARYDGRKPDIVALPETIVCGGRRGSAAERSVRLEGPVLESFSQKAKQHNTYLTVPLDMIEDETGGVFRNSMALVDRSGGLVGIYHKYHVVLSQDGTTLEGGITPGTDFPVFHCDFGRIGFQICFDASYDDGWSALKRKGAELVVWSTASPQTARPRAIALRENYYIVSSTWRNNLSLFEPTGMIVRQTQEPEDILVQEIDLSYLILPWSQALRNGAYLQERYGRRIGFRYYESEDCGIFWSNDPETPIERMVQDSGLQNRDQLYARNKEMQERMRG